MSEREIQSILLLHDTLLQSEEIQRGSMVAITMMLRLRLEGKESIKCLRIWNQKELIGMSCSCNSNVC